LKLWAHGFTGDDGPCGSQRFHPLTASAEQVRTIDRIRVAQPALAVQPLKWVVVGVEQLAGTIDKFTATAPPSG
jgi:hypothetical protein